MGSRSNEVGRSTNEGPQHVVKIQRFFLGQTPVTQSQWRLVASWPKIATDLNPDPSLFKGSDRPVERVRWDEAVEFCIRLSKATGLRYRLPSEAQWEFACRAGTYSPFAFGETLTSSIANYDGNSTYGSGPAGIYRCETTEVASFPANAWGFHDMHGNVWEWCLDTWHDSFRGAPTDGGAWFDHFKEDRVLRGGSWLNQPVTCRSAFRVGNHLGNRDDLVGFRLCCLPEN